MPSCLEYCLFMCRSGLARLRTRHMVESDNPQLFGQFGILAIASQVTQASLLEILSANLGTLLGPMPCLLLLGFK